MARLLGFFIQEASRGALVGHQTVDKSADKGGADGGGLDDAAGDARSPSIESLSAMSDQFP